MKLFKLRPAVKDYIWGGTNLKKFWNKSADSQKIAETWELSFHRDGVSTVAAAVAVGDDAGKFENRTESPGIDGTPESPGIGRCVGQPVTEAVAPSEYGSACGTFPFFPVLVKFIDAEDNLSVQVHPSDAYALTHENQFGKTEMWYIADAEPGAGIFCGFVRELSPEEYARRIADGTLTEVLRFFEVKKGESYFIPSGTVHAIGRGTTICEIQQNSNLTYRIYDFGRIGNDGKPRELHAEKAKLVSVLRPYERLLPVRISESEEMLASCPYFSVMKKTVVGDAAIKTDETSFVSFTVTEGCGSVCVSEECGNDEECKNAEAFRHTEKAGATETLSFSESLPFVRGDTFLVPAARGIVHVEGNAVILVTRVE